MLLKRLTLTMATSLLALAGTVGTATAAHAANTGDQSGPCYINIQGNNNTVGRGGLTGADTLPQVGVETSNLLAAPQNNADVIAPLTGGTNVSAVCTLLSPVGDGVFYLVVTTVNGYPTAGWLQAEVVSSTADVPACLPA